MALNELEAFASIQQIEQYWNSVYNNIYRCNMVLQNVGNVSNDAKRKQYEGEALFIRAYHYFNLVRLLVLFFGLINQSVLRKHSHMTEWL